MSLRDTIQAAIKEHSGEPDAGDAGGVIEGAATEVAADAGQAAASIAGGEGADALGTADPTGPARDASGKFAAKPADAAAADAQQASAAPAATPEPQAQAETIRVPQALPTPLKAKFKDLPAEWRDAFIKREDDVNAMRDQWAPKGEKLNRLEAIVAPRREYLAINGMDEFTWIERLASAEQVLRNDPVQGILYLAQSYGADPHQLIARMTGGQPGGAQGGFLPMDPNLQAILGEVQTLKQTVTQQQQSAEEAQRAQVMAQIGAFASDPANLYFEDVKDDIAALLSSGRATDLKDAYDKACWANPEVRDLLLKERAVKTAQPDPQAQARAKAAAAAQAAGSVTGAARAGGTPPGGADPANLRDTIRAAFDEHAGRV